MGSLLELGSKETWALITWLVFAIYLHSRLLKGWQGQKPLLGSCGFFVIWICYLGVNFLGKGLHSYGWVL
jgi:ABC-type transport system involved in cytochrome c biogenesis permease subunit